MDIFKLQLRFLYFTIEEKKHYIRKCFGFLAHHKLCLHNICLCNRQIAIFILKLSFLYLSTLERTLYAKMICFPCVETAIFVLDVRYKIKIYIY